MVRPRASHVLTHVQWSLESQREADGQETENEANPALLRRGDRRPAEESSRADCPRDNAESISQDGVCA